MKFVADEMLGKLAKWLRILGYDTLYIKNKDDNYLINSAFKEQRMLLTRDTAMVERKYIPQYILIKSDNYLEQIKQIIGEYKIVPNRDMFFSRCLLCNSEIKPILKDDIKEKVPEYVYDTQDNFLFCRKCGKIYWKGSHIENAMKKIMELLVK
jgi:uncharacterized protein with PIN domain